ncbi:hypothetical protein GCM10022284_02840 [Streptomyces hundungensis]
MARRGSAPDPVRTLRAPVLKLPQGLKGQGQGRPHDGLKKPRTGAAKGRGELRDQP